MSERELMQLVRDACRWLGLLTYHTRDSRGGDPGFPDLVIAGPGGFMFRELKSADGRHSRAQLHWQHVLTSAGADIATWRPHQWPEHIMRELRQLARQPEGSTIAAHHDRL